MSDRIYTRSERSRRAGLIFRGVRQAAADAVQPGIDRQIDRIDARAEDRFEREAIAAHRQLVAARDAVAAAKVTERTVGRGERAPAKQATREAEKNLQRAERAARRYL